LTHCSTTDLIALTGTTEDATTVLTPIIQAADREVDAYLAPHGVSASDTGPCQQASLKLAMAGLLERGLHKGEYQASNPEFTSSVDVMRAIESNRKAAFALLDQHIEAQTSASVGTRVFVRRVDGKC
jgi:hypothetical protein